MMRSYYRLFLMTLTLFAYGCKSGGGGESNDTGTVEAPEDTGTGEAPEDTGTGEAPEDTGSGEASEDTGTGEAPEDTGTGETTPCAGVTCNTPPDNACDGTFGLAVYNRVGWCDRGDCHYGFRQEECENGTCSDGVCSGSPCQGVTCDAPPANECADSDTLRMYNPVGRCAETGDAPFCEYFSVEVTCDGGCEAGACAGDPCAHVVCDDPPARYCEEGYLVVWDTVARCENGECIYHTQAVDCGPSGCEDGACAADDPCAHLECGTPPANRCMDENTLRAYDAEGACADGTCLFTHQDLVCPAGCVNGRCVDDACIGITCEEAPASRCLDDDTLVFWDGDPGTCTDGVCAYGVGDAACDGGCTDGQCAGDACVGLICNDPPADYCRNETSLVTYELPGVCSDGICGYELALVTCDCQDGACVDDEQDTGTGEEMDTETDTGSGEGMDTETDTGEEMDTETNTGEETGTETGGEMDTETDTGTGEPQDTGDEGIVCTLENAAEVCGVDPCVDGYCCNLPCGGFCEACNVEGSRGVCTPIPSGEDPDEECEAEAENTCGQNGFCDGDRGCELFSIETACNDFDICSEEDHCDGLGNCVPGVALADFTPCDVVTEPDRDYDICVEGRCVSPGCGDPSCNVPGPHFPLADTNQRSCYDNDAAIECPADGAEFYGQDAQYGWDLDNAEVARYTKTEPVVDEPIVEDNVTGLVWQGCVAGLSRISCTVGSAQTYNWSDALAYCNDLVWGGTDDWRLPDEYELQSIIYDDRNHPSIDEARFSATPSYYYYWSSSFYAGSTSSSWAVDFLYGIVAYSSYSSYVRCVRGNPEPRPSTRFVRDTAASSEPLVEDTATGLVWQGCAAGQTGTSCEVGESAYYTWQEALAYCEGLTWAGLDDWRLPDAVELRTIVDNRMVTPAIDTMTFPNTLWDGFWTATTYTGTYSNSLYVNFDTGVLDDASKSNVGLIRCVRDGE